MSFPSAVWVVSAGSQMPVGSLVPEATRCRAFQSMMATKMRALSGSPMPTGAPECLLASIRAQCRVVFHLHARRARRPVVGLSEFYDARPQAVFVEDAGHQVAGCDVDEGRGCRGQFRAIAAAHSVESPLPTELIRKCVVTAGPELRIRIFAREARQARVFHVPVGNRVARGCRVFGGFGLLPADEKPEFIRLPGVDALGRARGVLRGCPHRW